MTRDVDADHVIAESARAWHRARITARAETDRLLDDDGPAQTRQVNQSVDAEVWAQWRLSEALASEAAWLSRQPGQGAGRASPQSHAPHRPALTEEDR